MVSAVSGAEYSYSRNFNSEYAIYNVNDLENFGSVVRNEFPDNSFDFSTSSAEVVVIATPALSIEDQMTLNTLVADYKTAYLTRHLANQKVVRLAEVKVKDEELFAVGFVYDSESFGLNREDITMWNQIWNLVHMGGLTLPQSVATMDRDTYTFTTTEQLDAWYGTGMYRVQWVYSTSRALDASIKACTTIAELNAIVDDRT